MTGMAAQTTTSPTARSPPSWLIVPKIRAPSTMNAPWAKLTTPVARNTSTKPTPIRARMQPVVRPVSTIVDRSALMRHHRPRRGRAPGAPRAVSGSLAWTSQDEVLVDDLRGAGGVVPGVDVLLGVGRVNR